MLAVSGGADSMAMLLAFNELAQARRLNLLASVAHLDHGLRGAQGDVDAQWVAAQAERLRFPVLLGKADAAQRSVNSRDNLEQAARLARYEFLAQAANAVRAEAVVLAHTLDDQAETVLLRLLRGSGAEGLSGMRRLRPLIANNAPFSASNAPLGAQRASVLVARPLLSWAQRADTESYCHRCDQEFLRDPMNDDRRFARVRVRKELLPLLHSFNPRVVEALARTAALLHEDAATLELHAAAVLREATPSPHQIPTSGGSASSGATSTDEIKEESSIGDASADVKVETAGAEIAGAEINVGVLAAAPLALQRRALRQWLRNARGDLRRVDEKHIRTVLHLLAGERGGRVVEIPGGGRVERRKGRLRFLA